MFKLVVLSVAVALVAAEPSVISPLWGGHLAAPLVAGPLGARLVAPVGAAIATPVAAVQLAPVPIGVSNYRGPLSLAPGQPANVLAVDGRPLDTLDVNVDRAVHLTAKALDHAGVHLLKKRSIVAPWGAHIGLPLSAHAVAPVPISAASAAPVPTLGWGHGVSLGHLW